MPKLKLTIRQATVTDIDALRNIEKSAAQLFLDSPYPELASFDPISPDQLERHIMEGAPLFVAETSPSSPTEPEPTGFAMAGRLDDGFHLYELSVHANHQRQGIGRALLNAVLDYAKNADASFVSLTTYSDIAWNAPFYASQGFERLTSEFMPHALGTILDAEIRRGARRQTRCVMQLKFTESPNDQA